MIRHPLIGKSRLDGTARTIVLVFLAFTSYVSLAPADQISGTWTVRFEDVNGDLFPSRLTRGLTYDEDPDGQSTFRQIGPNGATPPFPALYTGLNGQVTANLENFEAGGIDPALTIRAEAALGGRNVEVYTPVPAGPGENFDTPGTIYTSMSAALPNQNANFATNFDLDGNNTFEGGAFAILNGLVTGMRYAEYL